MKITTLKLYLTIASALLAGQALAGETAFKIFGQAVSMDEVSKEKQGDFYEIDRKRFDLVENMAYERFIKAYWEKKGADSKMSPMEARKAHLDKNVKVSDKEVNEILDKYKDNADFSKFSKDEQQKQIRDYLVNREAQSIEMSIIKDAIKKGDLVISLAPPIEPTFKLTLNDSDHTRFGPGADDIKPMGCDKKSCPITIVEYSEFECPYCSKAMPAVKRVLSEYRGKISWTTRDFPLSFHQRARPAAVAAHCAGDQGKFWGMYQAMFDNQRNLSDQDLEKYAHKLVSDKAKWNDCVKNPQAKHAIIQSNMDSGMTVGVSGTPAFFINGRRLSGALPFEEFKRVIDDELAKSKKKK